MTATAAFLAALALTSAYYSGIVPGLPKTLPTFVTLVELTAVLFAIAVLAWVVSMLATEQA